MTSAKIGVGVIGSGFIGAVHVDALRRIGNVEVVAIAERGPELAHQKADEWAIPRAYGDYRELIEDPDVQVVHNCTPNNLHLEINSAIIQSGRHVFSEKPLAMNSDESSKLLDLLETHPVVHGVNFNYRMYPLVQDMKRRVEQGELGSVRIVHGTYLQDWLLYPTDYNWRIEPEVSGATRAIGDLGSHWCDLAQTVTGLRIVEVFADFATVIPVRKRSRSATTFSDAVDNEDLEDVAVRSEDWATVLVHFDNGAKGVFSVSEVCAGRKCRFDIEVNGAVQTFYWNQEQGDRLWIGTRDAANREIIRDPNQLPPHIRRYTSAPAGHPEGWLDDNLSNMRAFYDFIRDGGDIAADTPRFATFKDGHQIMCILDAIAESARSQQWVTVRDPKAMPSTAMEVSIG